MAETVQPEDHLYRFGLESFRPGQREVIDAVMAGSNCLCIMPTGGGKSLCYQLPSVAREGTTLVVSPLIALMKDQVDSLEKLGIKATFVNSALTGNEQQERLLRFSMGEYDLLYVAPERFRSTRFLEAVRKTNVQLLAIDEAHCISEWGHDFRHDYARLGEFRERLGNPQTIALTATATTDVRVDVLNQLQLPDPKTFVSGFARDNLYYQVEQHRGKQAKHQALLAFLARTPGCGIIYASTRAACEEIRDLLLNESNRKVVAYHGGLMQDDRRRLQEVFMSGKAEIVVATNAFGMGIDKSDVRFVVHFNIPGSLEAYYQEAGRAGRDGQNSICLLLYSQNDRFVQEFFIDSAHPPKASIKQVYDYLCHHPDDPIELTQSELKEQLGLSIGPDGVGTCERLLEQAGVLERLDSNRNQAAVRVDTDAPNLAELLPSQAKTQRRVARAVGNLVAAQRFERVFFHPHDICTLSGEELVAVSRSLRELSRNEWFDYVPPFRGRAVHMLKREAPFHKLDIDYTRLEQRRRFNLEKLDRVIRFATTRRCRQRDILRYFGEATREKCGHCDNCGPGWKMPEPDSLVSHHDGVESDDEPQATPAMLEVSRIVLSGVARSHGRFGKMVVVGMLCGSRSAKMKKWRLDELSTFGLLSSFKQTEVAEIVDTLMALSLIKMVEVDKFRPTIHNTDRGKEVMMGRELLMEALELSPALLRKIERRFAKAKPVVVKSAVDVVPAPGRTLGASGSTASGSMADTETASETGKKTDNESDEEDVEESETAAKDGAETDEIDNGVDVGTEKRLANVDSGSDSQSDARVRSTSTSDDDVHASVRASHYWTWRLLKDGYSSDACLAIRGQTLAQICDDLLRCCESGLDVDPGWLINPDDLQWLEQHVPADGQIRPLIQDLPNTLTTSTVRLFTKCRAVATESRAAQAE